MGVELVCALALSRYNILIFLFCYSSSTILFICLTIKIQFHCIQVGQLQLLHTLHTLHTLRTPAQIIAFILLAGSFGNIACSAIAD